MGALVPLSDQKCIKLPAFLWPAEELPALLLSIDGMRQGECAAR